MGPSSAKARRICSWRLRSWGADMTGPEPCKPAGSKPSGPLRDRNATADGFRIADPGIRPVAETATLTFDGATLGALPGEAIAAACAASGMMNLGLRKDGSPRGIFCGMGVCQECLVTVDGRHSLRACMTPVE